MKVALVSDWLISYAGSEKVEEAILSLYPEADIFTCVYNKRVFENTLFSKHRIKESFISKLPKALKHYQKYLPFMPIAVEQFDLSSYDLIISSSHAVAKGVLTGPDQLHICYCHSPIRYAWDFQNQYLKEAGCSKGIKSIIIRYLLHKIRIWDYRTVAGVDNFIANSRYIARRIAKVYKREAKVIYPNVAIGDFECVSKKSDFYLAASRLVPYKKISLIIDAFAKMPDKKLIVIGDGDQRKEIEKKLTSNIEFLGYQPFEKLKLMMQNAKAFVFAAEEDFGIMPIEAQACGTPVIAYGRGGALETVIDGKTGILFSEQTEESICDAVDKFEKEGVAFDAERIREAVLKFSEQRFLSEFSDYIKTQWENFSKKRGY